MVCGELQTRDNEKLIIKGVSINSKEISNGNIYIPIIRNKNGHDYIKEAIKNGASAVLWQKDQLNPPINDIPTIIVEDTLKALQKLANNYRNQLNVKVIGITGSNGKTTTKDMLASVLSPVFKVHKTQGNLNGKYGVPLTILNISDDSQVAVLEMGMSEKGEIETLSKIANPDIVVITMIGVSHISNLGSRSEISKAKLEIIKGLKPGGCLIYNGDEPLLKKGIETLDMKEYEKFSFGKSSCNDFYISSVLHEFNKIKFQVNDLSIPTYELNILGKHNVFNALAAIAVAKKMGISNEHILSGLSNVNLTGMRMEMISSEYGFKVINDAWNASPDSVQSAIETFQDLEGFGKKILVLGDMLELGSDEIRYHKEIAQDINSEKIYALFTYGNLAKYIAEEFEKKARNDIVIKCYQDMDNILKDLLTITDEKDIILVKGSRGMNLDALVTKLAKL